MLLRQWIRKHVGRRGAYLAFLTVLDLAYGWAIYKANIRAAPHVGYIIPLHAWGVVWMTTGLICLTGVVIRSDRFQYSFAALMKALWALLWVDLWIKGVPGAWISTVVWLAFALNTLLVAGWPEQR